MSQPGAQRKRLQIRMRFLKQLKSHVDSYLGAPTGDLKQYMTSYSKSLGGHWRKAGPTDILAGIESAEVVYGSDFHAFPQSQRTHLRILRSLPEDRRVLLALEIFESKDQRTLDQYLAGRLSEETFLKKIKWEERWGFPWTNYLPLLNLAKERGYKVLALNRRLKKRTGKGLLVRDRHAAKIIAAHIKADNDSLLYVIFGDLHLAPGHLPRCVNLSLGRPARSVTIFQNSEHLYMKLARQALENDVSVLKKGGGTFCVLSSPPWVKWQSYLLFLERHYDRELEDDRNLEFSDYVVGLIRLLQDDFGLRLKNIDLAVYGQQNDGFWVALEKAIPSKDLPLAEKLVATGRSFFVPSGGIFFLARPTVNHAASLAAEYLQSRLSGRTRLLWSMPEDFHARVWVEALSFFISKMVNHKRKPESLDEFYRNCETRGSEGRNVLALVSGRNLGGRTSRRSSYLEATRFLGMHLGEKMWLAWLGRRISQKDVLDWLKRDVDARDFPDFYHSVVRRVGRKTSSATDKKTHNMKL